MEEILIQKIIPGDGIILMAFYKTQVELLRICMENLQRAKPEIGAELIRVRTVDGMQGSENHLIILDIVTTHAIGFVRQRNRINVATSRARDSMLIFGSIKTLWDIDKEKRPYLSEVISYYQDADLVGEVVPYDSAYLPLTYAAIDAMHEDEAMEEGEVLSEDVQMNEPPGDQTAEDAPSWGGQVGPAQGEDSADPSLTQIDW